MIFSAMETILVALIVVMLTACGGGDPLPPQRDNTLEQQRPLPGGGQVKP